MNETRAHLQIDRHLPEILAAIRSHGRLVLVAPPGAGKTTRVAPCVVRDGPVILLQPRRIAARSIARRIALENGWTVGREVGWQVRFERNFTPQTSLLVATEGILTARLQSDPLLSDFRTVILDEFHERSIHADLALALVKQAREARPELRLIVMSATLDGKRVAEYLDDCPTFEIEGRRHPVEVTYSAGTSPAAAVRETIALPGGHLLCFLPGKGEIAGVAEELGRSPLGKDVRVLPLHGSLDGEAQDRALAPGTFRKVILATNIAETSLTVEGVTDVIDGGFHKVLRFDSGKAVDRLELEWIPQDAADQRAGRAGREGPGRALRLWDPQLRLRPHREAEIQRIDLAGPVLDVLAWGGDPLTLDWFEPPPLERFVAAGELLEQLKFVRGGRLTELGRVANQLPLHPRIASVLLAAGATPRAARICAVLAEGSFRSPENLATPCDLFWASDKPDRLSRSVDRVARDLTRRSREMQADLDDDESDERILRALLAGFPDRVAQRRAPGSDRLLLARGFGARLARESGVREGDYLVALDLVSTGRGGADEALVTAAAQISKEWLSPTSETVVHEYNTGTESVRAFLRTRYLELTIAERPVAPDPDEAGHILEEVLRTRQLDEPSSSLLIRAELAGLSIDLDQARRLACAGQVRLPSLNLKWSLTSDQLRTIERLCPERIRVPSGRDILIDYSSGEPTLRVKLQELFGWAETPRVGRDRRPLTIELLAPNQRPVQRTRDLRSFWANTYPEVRKELRGRYPKHPWPEDPWSAQATAGTKRRQ